MGAAFFVGYVFLFCGIALFCFLIELVKSLLGAEKGKRGKAFLAAGGGLLAIPLLFVLVVRLVNMTSWLDPSYVDTGRYVEEKTRESFTADGRSYCELDLPYAQEIPEGEAWLTFDDTDYTDGIHTVLFGRFYRRGNYYAVPNDAGVEMVKVGGNVYCPTDQVGKAEAWYGDRTQYEWCVYDRKRRTYVPFEEEKAGELQLWLDQTEEETGQFLKEQNPKQWNRADTPGESTWEDSQGGAVVVILERKRELAEKTWLQQVSRDGLVEWKESHKVSLYQYEDRLWQMGASWEVTEGRAYLLFPVPKELKSCIDGALS